MRILFINPPSKASKYIPQKCFPPVSLLYLASNLIENNYNVNIIDANALRLSNNKIIEKIKNFMPDLIGIPLFSDIFFETYTLIKEIKKFFSCKIVVGGPHINGSDKEVLRDLKEVDFAIKGEAEESLLKLCQAIEKKIDFSKVEGLYYKVGDEIFSNPMGAFCRDLDKIKFPKREILEEVYRKKKYYLILTKERPIDTIITSRGCPFKCGFCCMVSKDYRARSPENVLEEILSIYRRGIKNIDIGDANFTFDRERAMRIFNLIKKEKLNIRFRIKSRVDTIDKELVKNAKKAGVYLISMGIESGSQKILQQMNKGITIEQSLKACQIVMNEGIKLNTGWIIGYPNETEETIKETLRLILKIKPTTASINILIPYPGTEVYQKAKAEKTLIGDWNLENKTTPWIKLPWIKSYNDLKNILRWMKNKIYYRPYYIFNFGKEILENANFLLARYTLQEAIKSIKK
ncbi:MAG: radical SAM protein [Candidatus Aenigmatarchaeota archaeon]